ncbi:RF-1 domain-containing protein [Schizophyllum amplum]|uniref:RF-1 domain-containing protein n=1 Tax=Schizophyllum amplum TaxID=97359 RepID=A0A550CU53_9AGAR|nr:RF-1 domain-containing protein [Auriculariopsis ampla]
MLLLPFRHHVCTLSRGLLTSWALHTSRLASGLAKPPPHKALHDTQTMNDAKHWVQEFKSADIPKSLVEITFSRSSGPGGQNVNKVNTKATLRCSVNSSWIPLWATARLRESTHYVRATDSILLTSTAHRSQAQNIEDCLRKLHGVVISASSADIRNEASEEQKQRVKGLERADKERRKREKMHRSQLKQSRSGRPEF